MTKLITITVLLWIAIAYELYKTVFGKPNVIEITLILIAGVVYLVWFCSALIGNGNKEML